MGRAVVAFGAIPLGGLAGVVASQGGTSGGLLLLVSVPVALLAMRGLGRQLESSGRRSIPDGWDAATIWRGTITPKDRLAHDLWTRGHELWNRVNTASGGLPQAERAAFRDLAYRAHVEVARLVEAERRGHADEIELHTRTACDALARFGRATAVAPEYVRGDALPRRGQVEPGGVLSDADESTSPVMGLPDESATGERRWPVYGGR